MGNYCCNRAILLSKLKWVFAIFKLAKFSTVFSMFLSLGAYAVIYGWKFGVALIYLLFIHEMGHLWAAKRKGIPTSPAIFIPFMGALIGMKEMPKMQKMKHILPIWVLFSDYFHFTGYSTLHDNERAVLGAHYFTWKHD